MIRLIKDNVERVVSSEEDVNRLIAKGFKRMEVIERGAHEEKKEGSKADFNSLSVKELRELAKEKGIDAASSLNKEDLLKVLGSDGNE